MPRFYFCYISLLTKELITHIHGSIIFMTDFELDIINKNICNNINELLPENEMISFLNGGSKRIRSKLAILYIKANEKTLDDNVYKIITASELIHNASLLHDDVIDDSELRRGITTIGNKYSPKISILCGDYVVSSAIELLLKLNNNTISNIFNECVKNMAKAEIQQYFLRNKIPSKREYIDICKGKTGGLFAAVLEGCAVYLNLDRNTAVKFGEIFGICFQMQNDISDFSFAEDKKNKIYTAKEILGIENTNILSDNYKQELREILGNFPDNNYKSDLERLISEL